MGTRYPTYRFARYDLVTTNAQVLTEPINSGLVGNRPAKFSHG